MKLYEYLDIAKLEEQIAEGYVNQRFHNKFSNLAIYCYSKSATLNYEWNEITCKCRGLIVDTSTMDIIARPFEKFFNLGEAMGITREQFPDRFPKITDKLDGNLITLYPWQGRWYAASKGSFHSDHADWANSWLVKNYSETFWPTGYTPVFEMIAEEVNHHVVHYGQAASGLYLIALINNKTGEELNDVSRVQWANMNDIPYIPLEMIPIEQALAENEKNAEGYIFAWDRAGTTPLRVKVKFADFLALQRLVHHTGPKEILDYLRRPELRCYLDEIFDPARTPEEFIKYVKGWMDRFTEAYHAIEVEAATDLLGLRAALGDASRKEYAVRAVECRYPGVVFALMDGDNEVLKKRIWKLVEPVANQFDDVRTIITQEE
jgi:RNA ligase